jgi:hypothetical protein
MANEICPMGGNVSPCIENCKLFNKENKTCGLVTNNKYISGYVSTLAVGLTEVKSRLIDLEREVDLLKKKKSTGK